MIYIVIWFGEIKIFKKEGRIIREGKVEFRKEVGFILKVVVFIFI